MRRYFFSLILLLMSLAAPSLADESRWGAIALGGNGFGATRGRFDEASAALGALRQCEESGGAGECRIRLVYRNRCAAYATGDDRQVGVAFADAIEQATMLALRSCTETTSNCRIDYVACSFPASFN